MAYAIRGLGLVICLVLVSSLTACSLAQSDSQAATASTTTSTAAYVYIQIQGPQGAVYGFRASSTGHLSAIPGSPFKPAGEIIGSTPTKFFTLGKTLIHSYGIASDGAIESQLSQVPFFDYSGSECTSSTSSQNGAVLDLTGKYIYVRLECGVAIYSQDYGMGSTEYQSYLIHSDGAFSYDGDTDLPMCSGCDVYADLPSVLGSESFAYANNQPERGPIGFRRTSAGTLELTHFTETDPVVTNCVGEYRDHSVFGPDASPTGKYLVLQLAGCRSSFWQLGSYTVASDGNISTTNTWSNMPTPSIDNPLTTFSPSGDLLVAYADDGDDAGGIEIYKFNGAAPLTLYQTLLTGKPIDQVAFDASDHLYAISGPDNKLYVFTVTPTSVTETSSINIGSPFKMIVVSK